MLRTHITELKQTVEILGERAITCFESGAGAPIIVRRWREGGRLREAREGCDPHKGRHQRGHSLRPSQKETQTPAESPQGESRSLTEGREQVSREEHGGLHWSRFFQGLEPSRIRYWARRWLGCQPQCPGRALRNARTRPKW